MIIATQLKKVVDTAIQLYDMYEEPLRDYLGMSYLGHPCARLLWYSFRLTHTTLKGESARSLRLLNRGKKEEERVYQYLDWANFTYLAKNPADGKQFEYHGPYGPHSQGHCDGLIWNIPDMPFQWLLMEIKTHNDKNFTAAVNRGVKSANPVHYCQMQRYIRAHNEQYPGYNIMYGLYIAINKNNDSMHWEIVPVNDDAADMLIQREMSIIESEGAPSRLINDINFFTCRFCDYKYQCHGITDFPVHCRTCQNVAVCNNGEWKCEAPLAPKNNGGPLTLADQLEGCPAYLKNFTL